MAKSWPKSQHRGGPKTRYGDKFQVISGVGSGGGGGGGGGGDGLGAELVTNGAFAADTDWTKDTGWAIAAGVATATATAAAAFLHQAVALVPGRNYIIVYTITAFTSGNIAWSISNGQIGLTRGGTGTFSEVFFVNSASAELRFGRVTSDFTGSIDDVSLKQLGPP